MPGYPTRKGLLGGPQTRTKAAIGTQASTTPAHSTLELSLTVLVYRMLSPLTVL